MEWKEYKYYGQFGPQNEVVHRPIIGLSISNNDIDWLDQCTALIDSGCDMTSIDADFAESLRIDTAKCVKFKVGGIVGEPVEAFRSKVYIKIDGYDEPMEIEARFVPGMKFAALLGHNDFFEMFKVRFEKKYRKFYLQKETS